MSAANRGAEALTEVRARWSRRKIAEGLCGKCGREPHRHGKQHCATCSARDSAAARESHRLHYQHRRFTGPDGRRHNLCRRCGEPGHQAKTCKRQIYGGAP